MCPFCFANIGVVVAGLVSTGGLAALAATVSRNKKSKGDTTSKVNERSREDVEYR